MTTSIQYPNEVKMSNKNYANGQKFSKFFGYISRDSENKEEQQQILQAYGIVESQILFADDFTTVSSEISTYMKFKDIKTAYLIVASIKRFYTSTHNFLKLQSQLSENNIRLVCLDLIEKTGKCFSVETFDCNFINNIADIMNQLWEFEEENRIKIQKKGIERAKAENKYQGRKTVINDKLIYQVRELKEEKSLTITDIARITKKSRATIYKVLKDSRYEKFSKIYPDAKTNQDNIRTAYS